VSRVEGLVQTSLQLQSTKGVSQEKSVSKTLPETNWRLRWIQESPTLARQEQTLVDEVAHMLA
jgi:hypothetical protein